MAGWSKEVLDSVEEALLLEWGHGTRPRIRAGMLQGPKTWEKISLGLKSINSTVPSLGVWIQRGSEKHEDNKNGGGVVGFGATAVLVWVFLSHGGPPVFPRP